MKKKKVVIWGIVIITALFVTGIFMGGCGKKESVKEETQEEAEIPETTEEITEEISEVPTTPEIPLTQQKAPTPTPITPTQTTPIKKPPKPPTTPETKPQSPVPPQPQWQYEILSEEEKEFNILFTLWGETYLDLSLPPDTTPQEIEITAILTLKTPDYYSPKINKEGAIIPIPVEGTFEAPNKVVFRETPGDYVGEETPGYYMGEDCLVVQIKEPFVTVQTGNGPKTIDTTQVEERENAWVCQESWPTEVEIPPVKDARNIGAVAVIPPQNTKLEVPAKFCVYTTSEPMAKITYPSITSPEGYPEKKIKGQVIVAGEVQK